MDFTHYQAALERDGFVVIRQFLTGGDFAELTSNIDRYIRDIVPTLPDSDAFYHDKRRPETLKQMQRMGGLDTFFSDYRKHPRWTALGESLLNEPVDALQPEWFNKVPDTEHVTPPHQDNYYFNLRPPNVITAWLALDSVDEENGCLRYVVGSHRQGLRPHATTKVLGFSQGITDYGPEDKSKEAVVRLQPGDLAVHHGETIHWADSNWSTTRNRRAFAIVIQGISCQLDEESRQRHQENLRRQHESMGLDSK